MSSSAWPLVVAIAVLLPFAHSQNQYERSAVEEPPIRIDPGSLKSLYGDAYGVRDLETGDGASSDPAHGRSRRQSAPINPWGMPRYAYCLFSILELNKVDGVEQSFYVDSRFTCYNQEPSLTGTLPPGFMAPMPQNVSDALAANSLLLSLDWINQREISVTSDRRDFLMSIVPDPFREIGGVPPLPHWDLATTPWVGATMRVSGLFKASLELQDFPFDRQTVWINVSAFVLPNFMLFAHPSWLPGFTITGDTQDVIGWDIETETVRNVTKFFPEYGMSMPYLSIAITVKRVPNFYINKIVIGVIFVTVMSQLTFLIGPRDSNRPVAALTAFLGIVTYLFVISNDVPKVAYLTRMDRFVNLSFYFVFMDFLIHTVFYAIFRFADLAEERAKEKAAHAHKYRKAPPTARNDPYDSTFAADADDHQGDSVMVDVSALPRSGGTAYLDDDGVPMVAPPGWWSIRTHLRAMDFILLVCAVLSYAIAVIAILTGAST